MDQTNVNVSFRGILIPERPFFSSLSAKISRSAARCDLEKWENHISQNVTLLLKDQDAESFFSPTVLQGRDGLALLAVLAVPDVVGGFYSELVGREGLQPDEEEAQGSTSTWVINYGAGS